MLPYMSPKTFSTITVLSLAAPILVMVNIIFVLYWLIGLKKQLLLSLICLFLGYFMSTPFYKFKKTTQKSANEISVMNYNVHLFNIYNWIKDENIPSKINAFIKEEDPDILCVQEYHSSGKTVINYPYQFIKTVDNRKAFGQAIYSKFEIVNKGSLNFENSQNNAIFIDVKKGLDTIRIYNIHLESLGLKPEKDNFGEKNSEKLLQRLSQGFIKQQEQVIQIKKHQKECRYPVIISGDFNNTAYSWIYKNIKHNMKDSYLESGSGFGKTFNFKRFPLRIDFILADKIFQINEHKNYTIGFSDHFPIMVKIGL
jgi:endonuclease/exonuclease/phosphatase family metal-dependent hydrolase